MRFSSRDFDGAGRPSFSHGLRFFSGQRSWGVSLFGRLVERGIRAHKKFWRNRPNDHGRGFKAFFQRPARYPGAGKSGVNVNRLWCRWALGVSFFPSCTLSDSNLAASAAPLGPRGFGRRGFGQASFFAEERRRNCLTERELEINGARPRLRGPKERQEIEFIALSPAPTLGRE